jgi:hypothetical protein
VAHAKGFPVGDTPSYWFAPFFVLIAQHIFRYVRYRVRYSGAWVVEVTLVPGRSEGRLRPPPPYEVVETDSRRSALQLVDQKVDGLDR